MSNGRLPLVPIALAALIALTTALTRVKVEREYQDVALIADYGEVQSLAAVAGLEVGAALARLKQAGLTSVAIEEPLVQDLVNSGDLRTSRGLASTQLTATTARGAVALRTLARKFKLDPGVAVVPITSAWSLLANSGGGLDPAAFQEVRAAGLEPVARLRNSPGIEPNSLRAGLGEARALGARLVIFSGDKVYGYRALTPVTASALKEFGLAWGRIEFAAQKGEDKLAEHLLKRDPKTSYVRVHSITEGEMAKTAPALVIERYRRAAKEREIRACFVRLLLDPQEEMLAANSDYLGSIAAAVADSGLRLGPARPLTWMAIGRLHRLGVAAGVTAAAAWLLTLLSGAFRARRWLLWWAALYLPSIALLVLKPDLAARLLALLAGLTFPTLGARWAWLRLQLQPPRSLPGAIAVLWVTVGWAVLGGLMVVGLLSQTSYLLAHDTFTGVKLTQLVPLLAAAALVTTGLTLPGVGLAEARASWRRFWTSPVLVLHTVLAMVVLVLVGMLLLRSGNEGVEISETELRFRALLEVVFGARPRTKEFLLGHPALLLAALAAWRGHQAWVAPLYLLGMVGVVSTLNTFCHLHTPLTQSLLRTFHALWLGTVLGLLVYAVARPKRGEG